MQIFDALFFMMGHTELSLPPATEMKHSVCNISAHKSVDSMPEVLIGADQKSTNIIPDSQKEKMCSTKTTLFVQIV